MSRRSAPATGSADLAIRVLDAATGEVLDADDDVEDLGPEAVVRATEAGRRSRWRASTPRNRAGSSSTTSGRGFRPPPLS